MMAAAFWHSSESVAAWACTQPQWQAHAQAGTQAAIAVAAHMAHLSARPWKFKLPVAQCRGSSSLCLGYC